MTCTPHTPIIIGDILLLKMQKLALTHLNTGGGSKEETVRAAPHTHSLNNTHLKPVVFLLCDVKHWRTESNYTLVPLLQKAKHR